MNWRTVTKAIKLTTESVNNGIFQKELVIINNAIITGISIGDAFMTSKVIPEMAIHMIAIGEETGALEAMLENISKREERKQVRATATKAVIRGLKLTVFSITNSK